ncbi:hypothetical protein F0562_002122 [Nyssa sinensis]|uniref:Uncharacterized protein n=1 Tax=Nyssa sinensis TaxID=561372 RepID=A0A5J5C544_9ASTE|nr:hypothetical protein F0562_002122 [Nyssa sinensis]
MILDPSGDEPPILEEVSLSPAQPETESLENMVPPPSDIPNQSLTGDVLETHKRQLPQRHTRVICWNS